MANQAYHPNASFADPPSHALAITPNDGTDISFTSRGVYVGTSGDLRVTMKGGETLTFPSIAAGIWHPMQVTRVWATSTTATGIIAGW